MKRRSIVGTIEYVTDKQGPQGWEQFMITPNPDGSRHLRAVCHMADSKLLRDVFLSVDKHWRPQDAHVHLRLADQFHGASHYVFSEDMVRVQTHSAKDGYHVQKIRLDRPAQAFGSHALQNDAWTYGAVDQIRMGNHPQVLDAVPVTSKLPNGGDGPNIIFSRQKHRYVGEEEITVAAGTFLTRHYEFLFDQWPPIHYWLCGEHYLLIQCRWDHLNQTYQLVSLDGYDPVS